MNFARRRIGLAAGLVVLAGLACVRLGPLPDGLLDGASRVSTLVTDRHGEPLYEIRTPDGLRGDVIAPTRIPPLVEHATLAAEDVRFHRHPGIDLRAIARAAWRNVRAGRIVEGGSTISQQVVKLLLERRSGRAASGWTAKLREAVLALRLEHRLSKPEILALYLNLAPYGNQLQGIGRAAQAYFGRPIDSLTPAEAAFLAALPQQPSRFNPWRDPSRALQRQQRVLATMAARGWLPVDALAQATAEQLSLARPTAAFTAPHFVERVRDEIGDRPVRHVRTTLDAALQRTVQGIIEAHRTELTRHHAHNVAVVVLHNATGEWLAWEGSGDYFDQEHGGAIDGAITPRQPGSAIKPFTYAVAFERGFHPASVLPDVPAQFLTAVDGVTYSPRNYDGRYRGPMLARAALAGSENVPAVALAARVGVPPIARLLRRAGLTTLERNAAHYGLGLTLGNAEVRLDELTAAYAMFARGGDHIAPRRILNVDGAAVPMPAVERIVSARTAFWIADVLSDTDARAFAFGRGGRLDFPFPVAAKTGTSQAYVDNWVIGFTPEVTVGVWVGNFDRTPLRGSTGITGAGPIFQAVMLAAVERVRGAAFAGTERTVLPPTPDVERREVCALSGMRAGDACPTRSLEWLPREHDETTCTWHHTSDRGLVTIWPDEYREWARREGLVRPDAQSVARHPSGDAERTRAEHAPGNRANVSGSTLTITRPLAGSVFLIDPTLRPEFQALTLAATGGEEPLSWTVDGVPVAGDPPRWPLVRGRHEIVVRDARGRTESIHIEVR